MDKETQKEMKKNQELIDHYDYLKNAASSTDCTGLIPALPESEDELDAYNDVYQYQTPPSNQNHRGSTPGYCSVTHPLSNHDNLTKNVVLRQTKCYNVFIVGKTSHNK